MILAVPAMATIRLRDDIVRAGDVARVATGGDLAILRLPNGRRTVTLDPDAMRTLVSHRLPGIPFTLRQRTSVRVQRGAAAVRPVTSCLIARTAIPAGTPIDDEMVERGRCAGPVVPVGYDRGLRAPVARHEIAPGTNLGTMRISGSASLAAGQSLTLRTRTGPVTIERQVVSMQPARTGARVFVRTQDGAVLAPRLMAAAR